MAREFDELQSQRQDTPYPEVAGLGDRLAREILMQFIRRAARGGAASAGPETVGSAEFLRRAQTRPGPGYTDPEEFLRRAQPRAPGPIQTGIAAGGAAGGAGLLANEAMRGPEPDVIPPGFKFDKPRPDQAARQQSSDLPTSIINRLLTSPAY